MLTDEEKSKIKAEEVFRDEIRKSLNRDNKSVFWIFLNSGLGIWFLSTIVIGLFTYFFNEYKETQKITNERNSKIKQLDLEIESRISQFWVHFDPLVNHSDTTLPLKVGTSYNTVKVFWEPFKNPPSFNPKLMTTIYKDYETRTTISLMIELSTLLQEKHGLSTKPEKVSSDAEYSTVLEPMKKDEAEKYHEIRKIEDAAIFIGGNGIFYKSDKPSIKEIWQSFSENIITDRWSYSFPYTDCLFC
jgi:hypothetical protein